MELKLMFETKYIFRQFSSPCVLCACTIFSLLLGARAFSIGSIFDKVREFSCCSAFVLSLSFLSAVLVRSMIFPLHLKNSGLTRLKFQVILSSLRGFWQVIASSTLASSTSGAAPFPLGPFNHILCVSGQSNCKEIKKPITKTTINDRDIKPRQTTASKGTACF